MWVPPNVGADLVRERREHEAELQAQMVEWKSVLDHWTAQLKQIDPALEMVRASEQATAPGLKPGFYHVLRHCPGGPPSLMVVETPDGGFVEPGSWVFDELAKADMWDDRVVKAKQKRALESARDKERNRERESEERLDEFVGRWKAATSPGVLISKGLP